MQLDEKNLLQNKKNLLQNKIINATIQYPLTQGEENVY